MIHNSRALYLEYALMQGENVMRVLGPDSIVSAGFFMAEHDSWWRTSFLTACVELYKSYGKLCIWVQYIFLLRKESLGNRTGCLNHTCYLQDGSRSICLSMKWACKLFLHPCLLSIHHALPSHCDNIYVWFTHASIGTDLYSVIGKKEPYSNALICLAVARSRSNGNPAFWFCDPVVAYLPVYSYLSEETSERQST